MPKERHAWKSYKTKARNATDVVVRAAPVACPGFCDRYEVRLLTFAEIMSVIESGMVKGSGYQTLRQAGILTQGSVEQAEGDKTCNKQQAVDRGCSRYLYKTLEMTGRNEHNVGRCRRT